MPGLRFPWASDPVVADTQALPEAPPAAAKPRGRRPAASARAIRPVTAADFLYHHLTVSGPAACIDRFAVAARGAGVIPWRLDGAVLEEEIFVRAVSVPAGRRALTVAGCRILARQFRDRAEAHHARATALVGRSLACPFDLHVLLPVPAEILQLGPNDPAALAWLTQHWGADQLRRVVRRPQPGIGRRRPAGHAVIGYGFFTAGDTPQAAIERIAADWPSLQFRLTPRPPD